MCSTVSIGWKENMMKRREFLGLSAAAIAISPIAKACRDKHGIRGPDWEDERCYKLDIRRSLSQSTLARAVFGMGVYEKVLDAQKRKRPYLFEFDGIGFGITPTSVSFDTREHPDCVTCSVTGRLWQRK